MTQIYLIRHAEAEGNLYRRAHGWYNSLLTGDGLRQVEALSKRFADIHIDAVYSSDLYRTMTTAGAVYRQKGLELHTDPGLREVYMGSWEDKTFGELFHTQREQMDLFHETSPDWRAPGGENFEEVRQRVGETLRKLALQHDGQTIAVASHGTAIRHVLALFQGISVADTAAQTQFSGNTAVSLLEFDGTDQNPRIVFENDSSHLPPELSDLYSRPKSAKRNRTYRDDNLWFRPWNPKEESELYYQARKEAWITIHGTIRGFNGEGFLHAAQTHSNARRSSVMCAMLDDKIAGIIQMDLTRDASQGIGGIPFFYLLPEYRSMGMGVQLLGQAVSTYRPLGRNRLRLRCAPENKIGQHFYKSHGFRKVGEEPGGCGSLDILEKYIGYELP